MDNRTLVFSRLDAGGRFHRDSFIGRLLHPGTSSFREITSKDSVHIAVTRENRVSVHVDSVSPLALDADHGSRYSLPKVVAHVLAHSREACGRLRRREPGNHRCDLDCEAKGARSTLDADGTATYEFSCRAAGAQGCRWKATATSEEELLVKVTDHVRAVHHVDVLTGTIAAFAVQLARSA